MWRRQSRTSRNFWVLLFSCSLVSWLQAAMVEGCPELCVCKWKSGKQTVECVNQGLGSIPGTGIDAGTQVLDMTGNTLQVLHRHQFQRLGLVNLQRLYLIRCRLGHLDDHALEGLTNLVELDLSENLLTTVPSITLGDTMSLMRLLLNRNSIHRLEAGAFAPLQQLVSLELSQCDIDHVERGAFDGLNSLEWLKLDGNKLRSMGATFILPRTLHGIDLHNNPWRCDCRLADLRTWIERANIPSNKEPICVWPPRLEKRTVKSLEPREFACPPEISPLSLFLEVDAGKNLSLLCKITGDPEPRLVWYHRGVRLAPPLTPTLAFEAWEADPDNRTYFLTVEGRLEKRSELFIFNVSEKDNGTFTCAGENLAGAAAANYTLRVLIPPPVEPPPAILVEYEYWLVIGGTILALVTLFLIIAIILVIKFCCSRRRQFEKDGTQSRKKFKRGSESSGSLATATSTSRSGTEKGGVVGIKGSPSTSTYDMDASGLTHLTGVGLGSCSSGGSGPSLLLKTSHSSGYASCVTVAEALDRSPDLISDAARDKDRWNHLYPSSHSSNNAIPTASITSSTSHVNSSSPAAPEMAPQHVYDILGHARQVHWQDQSYPPAPVHSPQYYVNPLPQHHHHSPLMSPSSSAHHPQPHPHLHPHQVLDPDGYPPDYGLPRPIDLERSYSSAGTVCHPGYLQTSQFFPDQKYPLPWSSMAPPPHVHPAAVAECYADDRYPQPVYGYACSMPTIGVPQQYSQEGFPSPPDGYKSTELAGGGAGETAVSESSRDRRAEYAAHPREHCHLPTAGLTSVTATAAASYDSLRRARLPSGTATDTVTTAATAARNPLPDPSVAPAASSTSTGGPASSSSVRHDRPAHESPDEGYEDEHTDGTEI